MPAWPWSRDQTAFIFRREGGTPPSDHEVLTVDPAGSFDLWRTIARASNPPSPVGRFRGQLPGGQSEELGAIVEACRRAKPIELSLPPDAAREKVVLGKRISTWADDKIPPAPFDRLATEARRLLGELTAFPEAAITVHLDDNKTAALKHLGAADLQLDLSGATIRAVRWADGLAADEWRAPIDGPRSVTAGAEWVYDLPFDHPHGGDAVVTAHVDDLLAFDGESWWACSLQTLL